jgi:hypothetical protein
MLVADPLSLCVGLVSLAVASLVSVTVRAYVRSLAPARVTLLTVLHEVLVHAYNLYLILLSLVVIIKAASGQVPHVASILLRLGIFATLSSVEGFLCSIATVRLLFVLKEQGHDCLINSQIVLIHLVGH